MILLGKIALGMAGVGLAGAGFLCSEGFVRVNVVERGVEVHHIRAIAPAMLAPIAVSLAPRSALAQAAWEIQPQLPVIHAALASLRDADDMVLVNVDEPGEHVRVAKSGGSIVVDVSAPDTSVHVSAPIRALSSTIDELAETPRQRIPQRLKPLVMPADHVAAKAATP